jgi:hypothetical protein
MELRVDDAATIALRAGLKSSPERAGASPGARESK